MQNDISEPDYLDQTADIVAAYARHNALPAASLPGLIASVHTALRDLSAAPKPAPQVPAVPIRKSITPDFLISLEDGKKYKSLRRTLRVQHNLTPDQYRAKWDLPHDYPMVAPNYSKKRSELAKTLGLGRKPGKLQSPPAAVSSKPRAKSKTP